MALYGMVVFVAWADRGKESRKVMKKIKLKTRTDITIDPAE
jgi:hypothetical protein